MEKFNIEFIKTERALSPTGIGVADFTINPYRGCFFNCIYCYVKFNKFARKHKLPYGSYVQIKENIIDILKKQLPLNTGKTVLIGATTDPYQPVEKKYKLTQQILILLKKYDYSPFILTKSDLILRDIEILKEMKNPKICITLNSKFIIDNFERNTPPIEKRIEVIETLNKNNIYTYAHIGPYFPYITDYKNFFDLLKNKTKRINFESLNFKMITNHKEFLKKINKYSANCEKKYIEIMSKKEVYNNYWNALEKEILEYNIAYNYKISIFFRAFNEYYKNDKNGGGVDEKMGETNKSRDTS